MIPNMSYKRLLIQPTFDALYEIPNKLHTSKQGLVRSQTSKHLIWCLVTHNKRNSM